MIGNQKDGNTPTALRIDGHKLSEFIYGTVTGMVALAGISEDPEGSWLRAASVIIVGAIAKGHLVAPSSAGNTFRWFRTNRCGCRVQRASLTGHVA